MKIPTIICVSGYAGHGKDTFSNILADILGSKKCLRVGYGDYVKFMASKYYGWSGEKDKAGRDLLQWLGTEKIRARVPNFWVDNVITMVEAFEDDYDYVIISDCRFPNEVREWLDSDYPVKAVWVERIGYDNGMTPEQKNHASEISMDDFPFDYYVRTTNLERLKVYAEFIAENVGEFNGR